MEKIVSPSSKDWLLKLDNTLRVYRTTLKTPIMSPFRLVYGKACHLPVELEHKAYWLIQKLNFEAKARGEKRFMKLNEMYEFKMDAYVYAKLYKERTKLMQDKHILAQNFKPGNHVLLYNSRLRLFLGKLKSKWSDPFTVIQEFSRGVVEIRDEKIST